MSLSERIAALNKAKASPQLSPQGSPVKLPNTSAVKEKAARFDGLGVAPAPRGSFGLGAPMSNGQKSNRELWGNRIPSVNKRAGDTPSSVGSRSPSRSRKSSNDAIVAAGTPDPLTEEAVGSLGAAVLVDPADPDAPAAFRSVAQSVVDDRHDASSSVGAVEAEDDLRNRSTLDVSTQEDEGRASPALSSSTVSESALEGAPPILSPTPSTTQLFTPSSRSLYDPRSVAATEGSSTGPTMATPSIIASIDATPISELSGLNLSGSMTSMSSDSHSAPLPLSAHLLQSLQASMPSRGSASGMDTPKSVMVETGSTDGNAKLDDLDMPDDELIGDASSTGRSAAEEEESELDLKSEKGGDDVDLDIQPALRMGAPVLPLSSAHLKSLNVQSALHRAALASGLQTPRSMIVEDGSDGSGRRSPFVPDDFSNPEVIIELPAEGHSGAGLPSAPLSPAVLAYTIGESPIQPPSASERAGSSLVAPHHEIDMSTPVAQQLLLPDVETPSSATRANPMDVSDEPVAPPLITTGTVKGPSADQESHKTDRSLPQFNVSTDNEITRLSVGTPALPSDLTPQPSPRMRTLSRTRTPVPEPASAPYYQNKPLPPPPQQPSPGNSLPPTPIIIQAFPPVPSNAPLLTMQGPSPSASSPAGFGSVPGIATSSSSRSGSRSPRPHSTVDPVMAPSNGNGSNLRRSVSATDIAEKKKPRRKKPQLIPGEWITDDNDARDSDDEETGWANIVVTKRIIS